MAHNGKLACIVIMKGLLIIFCIGIFNIITEKAPDGTLFFLKGSFIFGLILTGRMKLNEMLNMTPSSDG